jgi:hypothetical protein
LGEKYSVIAFNGTVVYVQEYHIRKMDGHTLDDEAKEKVKKCLEAAIERRSSEVRILFNFL